MPAGTARPPAEKAARDEHRRKLNQMSESDDARQDLELPRVG